MLAHYKWRVVSGKWPTYTTPHLDTIHPTRHASLQVRLTVPAGAVVITHYDVWHRATANTQSHDSLRWMFKFQFVR